MSGSGKRRRRLSAEEKLRILEEARQPQTTVAEVLRRHQLDATSFYRWERFPEREVMIPNTGVMARAFMTAAGERQA